MYLYLSIYTIAFKSEKERNYRYRQKGCKKGLRVITLQGAIEKSSPILLPQYWKNEWIGWQHNYFVFWW